MVSQDSLRIMYNHQPEHTSLALGDGKGDPSYLFTSVGVVVEIRGLKREQIDELQLNIEKRRVSYLDVDVKTVQNSTGIGLVNNGRPMVIGAEMVTQKCGPIEFEMTRKKLRFTF